MRLPRDRARGLGKRAACSPFSALWTALENPDARRGPFTGAPVQSLARPYCKPHQVSKVCSLWSNRAM